MQGYFERIAKKYVAWALLSSPANVYHRDTIGDASMSEQLYGVAEAAEVLEVTVQQARRYVTMGLVTASDPVKLRAQIVSRRYVITPDDLEAFRAWRNANVKPRGTSRRSRL